MARETKAQRLARQEAEREAFEAEQAVTYPRRLMAMLERATKVNFKLEVNGGKFSLKDRDEDYYEPLELTLDFSRENEDTLDTLNWRVDYKEREKAEAERIYQLRQNALTKLTAEERNVLGL